MEKGRVWTLPNDSSDCDFVVKEYIYDANKPKINKFGMYIVFTHPYKPYQLIANILNPKRMKKYISLDKFKQLGKYCNSCNIKKQLFPYLCDICQELIWCIDCYKIDGPIFCASCHNLIPESINDYMVDDIMVAEFTMYENFMYTSKSIYSFLDNNKYGVIPFCYCDEMAGS